MEQETYFLVSGEGEEGTWEIIETDNITEVLEKERCNGDRWAHAYRAKDAWYDPTWCYVVANNIETGEEKIIIDEDVVDFVYFDKDIKRRTNNV